MRHFQSIPSNAGTRSAARGLLPTWPEVLRALRKGLCLADPWVPAFAGMVDEK
jgi:hypothetical protein